MIPLARRAGCILGVALFPLMMSACVAEAPPAATRQPAAAPTLLLRPALASPSVSPAPSAAPSPVAAEQTYTVTAGDTLSSIADRFYSDASQWRLIFDANRDRLTAPEDLKIGMALRIPPRPTSTSSAR